MTAEDREFLNGQFSGINQRITDLRDDVHMYRKETQAAIKDSNDKIDSLNNRITGSVFGTLIALIGAGVSAVLSWFHPSGK